MGGALMQVGGGGLERGRGMTARDPGPLASDTCLWALPSGSLEKGENLWWSGQASWVRGNLSLWDAGGGREGGRSPVLRSAGRERGPLGGALGWVGAPRRSIHTLIFGSRCLGWKEGFQDAVILRYLGGLKFSNGHPCERGEGRS